VTFGCTGSGHQKYRDYRFMWFEMPSVRKCTEAAQTREVNAWEAQKDKRERGVSEDAPSACESQCGQERRETFVWARLAARPVG